MSFITRRVIREAGDAVVHWRVYGGGSSAVCGAQFWCSTYDESSIPDEQPMNCLRCILKEPHDADLRYQRLQADRR